MGEREEERERQIPTPAQFEEDLKEFLRDRHDPEVWGESTTACSYVVFVCLKLLGGMSGIITVTIDSWLIAYFRSHKRINPSKLSQAREILEKENNRVPSNSWVLASDGSFILKVSDLKLRGDKVMRLRTIQKRIFKRIEVAERRLNGFFLSVHKKTAKQEGELKSLSEKVASLQESCKAPHEDPRNCTKKEIIKKARVKMQEYTLLDGSRKLMVSKVKDGSIIDRFDNTPAPEKETDVVCPHFLKLKWAYGCPFDCKWCFLKGTLRFMPKGSAPVVKSYAKIKQHLGEFYRAETEPEILSTGELADSLMYENVEVPFSEFVIPLFEGQSRHKVLFLTKSADIKNLLEIEPHNQVITSFSLNAIPVAERWEKAPHVRRRIEAAKRLYEAGYEIRIRIDPIVPIENWQKPYSELLEMIFGNFIPERITLGSLRGLQSTINNCKDKSWVGYLGESSNFAGSE